MAHTAHDGLTVRSARFFNPDQPSYKWWVTLVVTLSGFLVTMSQVAVQVALPRIMTVFSLNLDQAQWVVIAYVIAGAILVPAVGWLGNRLGNRTLYLLSLLTFVSFSMLCAFAWSGTSLMVFRILQGLGGGPIPPMTMMFLTFTFPPEQRGLAMGIFGMGLTSGPILGTVIGGYLTEFLSWRMVFFISVIPGIFCMVMVPLVLPNTHEQDQQSLDLLGLITLSVFLITILVALSLGQREGWDSPFIQRLLLMATVSFFSFIACELLTTEPLVDLRLYANLTFSAASLIMLLFFMNFTSSTFVQVILVQRLLDYNPAEAGLVLLPGSIALALGFPFAGRIADKIDRRWILFVALALFAASSYWFSFLTLDRSYSWIIWLVMLRYSCGGFVFAPITSAALSHLPPDKVRMGSGLLNLMQSGFGNTFGLALMTTVLQRRLSSHLALLGQEQVPSSLPWREILEPARELVRQTGAIGEIGEAQVMGLLNRHLFQQASVAAYQDCFVMVMILCLVSLPFVLLIQKPKDQL